MPPCRVLGLKPSQFYHCHVRTVSDTCLNIKQYNLPAVSEGAPAAAKKCSQRSAGSSPGNTLEDNIPPHDDSDDKGTLTGPRMGFPTYNAESDFGPDLYTSLVSIQLNALCSVTYVGLDTSCWLSSALSLRTRSSQTDTIRHTPLIVTLFQLFLGASCCSCCTI